MLDRFRVFLSFRTTVAMFLHSLYLVLWGASLLGIQTLIASSGALLSYCLLKDNMHDIQRHSLHLHFIFDEKFGNSYFDYEVNR